MSCATDDAHSQAFLLKLKNRERENIFINYTPWTFKGNYNGLLS